MMQNFGTRIRYAALILCPPLLTWFAIRGDSFWPAVATSIILYLDIFIIYGNFGNPSNKPSKGLGREEGESLLLIGSISHDLKTPLTAILGYAEGLMDGVPSTPEKTGKYVDTIYAKAKEMEKLIDELHYYTKLEGNEYVCHKEPICLHDFLSDCIGALTLDFEINNVALVYFNYADAKEYVLADEEQLRRVVKNIAFNSMKYMGHDKGMIRVKVSDVGKELQVQMEDNGAGVHKEELPLLFDRFYRADASRGMGDGGSGLGLAIVKKIVEEHGGRVWADGEYAKGLSVYFTLRKYAKKKEVGEDGSDTDSGG